jgi:hypothetical protein
MTWSGFCFSAGLCDISEGAVVPEDRCKSPTSGNLLFILLIVVVLQKI